MAIIGYFTKHEDGSFEGKLQTLTLDRHITFEPLAKRGEKTPEYRVISDHADLGAAWEQTGKESNFLSVRLDDPSFVAPVSCRLVRIASKQGYNLIWERDRKHS